MPQYNANPSSVGADDLYIQSVAPPTFIQGAATDVIGVVGTASWGPVNQALFGGDQNAANSNWGSVSAVALTDPYDLATDLYLSFGQANQDGTLESQAVRVTDGTDTKASAPVPAATGTVTTATVTALYSGILGNGISLVMSAGSQPATTTATVVPPSVLGQPEVFANIPNATFGAAFVNALNLGLSNQRGPSNFLRGSNPLAGAHPPALATVTLAGGTDGRTGVTSAMLAGANGGIGASTGLWALQACDPPVGLVWLAGTTDETVAPTLAAFCTAIGCSTVFPLPAGTSSQGAQTIAQTAGIASPYFAFAKDWVYWLDGVNGQLRFTPPTAAILGRAATLGPQESPGNKGVNLIIGTERNGPILGNTPYSGPEVGLLEGAGIMLITNPIPAGRSFGIRHGITTSPSTVTAPFEWARMTTFLARSAASVFGIFVDELQSQQPNDPLRLAVKLASDNFLGNLEGLGQIDSFLTICSFNASPGAEPGFGVNTPASVAAHYLYHMWRVRYLSSVRFFVLSLQGGTTVVTVQNTGTPT